MEDQVYYILTPRHTIIFRGICGGCGESVRVERGIMELIMICPGDGKKAN